MAPSSASRHAGWGAGSRQLGLLCVSGEPAAGGSSRYSAHAQGTKSGRLSYSQITFLLLIYAQFDICHFSLFDWRPQVPRGHMWSCPDPAPLRCLLQHTGVKRCPLCHPVGNFLTPPTASHPVFLLDTYRHFSHQSLDGSGWAVLGLGLPGTWKALDEPLHGWLPGTRSCHLWRPRGCSRAGDPGSPWGALSPSGPAPAKPPIAPAESNQTRSSAVLMYSIFQKERHDFNIT